MEINFENVRDIIVETLSCDAEDVKLETNLVDRKSTRLNSSHIH